MQAAVSFSHSQPFPFQTMLYCCDVLLTIYFCGPLRSPQTAVTHQWLLWFSLSTLVFKESPAAASHLLFSPCFCFAE